MKQLPTCAALAACLLTSCIPAPPEEPPKTPPATTSSGESVATLEGFAQQIDGKDTSDHAETVGLSPGCHIVVTRVLAPVMNSATGRIFSRHVLYFQFNVTPRHRYVIEIGYKYMGRGATSDINVEVKTLVEFDEQGIEVRRLQEHYELEAPKTC